VVHLDFQSEEISTIPFSAALVLVIAHSGAKHDLGQSQYNVRRQECAAAATALGAANLGEITSARLADRRGSLDPVLYRRAAHIVGENERVVQAVRALQNENATELGALMNASHESSRTNFENSTPELDRLVTIAQGLPGVLGSRLTGGGFGGGTVTLAEVSRAPEIIERMRAYSPGAFACRVADGAATIWPGAGRPH
jgi:galactokinase